MFPASNELCRERTARFWQMSNLWVFCGFSPRNDGFVKVGSVLFDEVYVLFYFFRFFVLIKGKFFLSSTTHDMTIDTPLIRKLYMAPPVSVLPGIKKKSALLDCFHILLWGGELVGGGGWREWVKIWEYCLTEFCFLGWQDCTLCFRRDSNLIPRVLL